MQYDKRYLTINTDASFHPIKKTSGYAFYIKTDDFTIKSSGGFRKQEPKNIAEAEIMCIGNAVHHALNLAKLPKVDFIIINTDCMAAINAIKKGNDGLGGKVKDMIAALALRCGGAKYKVKHVRAHTNKDDSRSWVNNWCDKHAKKEMHQQKIKKS